MSLISVPGLRVALKEYESDKVRERAGGAERIRQIFGNKENLYMFQAEAGPRGEWWVALFVCLFQGVSVEKRATKRGNASAVTEKRLAEAISLVRWMAERSVHLISRRPLISLVTHMTALLVHSSGIYEPAVRDYAKALRTLLSYPPHLESIDEPLWKRLMSIIWAGALGDKISQDDQWQDDGHDELEGDNEDVDMDEKPAIDAKPGLGAHGRGRAGITNTQSELLLLLPILLSSPSAPILPAFPDKDAPQESPTSVGYFIILKIVRFLEMHSSETSAHLSVLRGCNLVLSELELNSRDEFVNAGTKLLPHLQALWLVKSKPLREQVVIALRMLHPFITHFSVAQSMKDVVQEQYGKLVDSLGKEVGLRWGIAPLDLSTLSLGQSTVIAKGDTDGIFTLGTVRPGHDFSHEHAFAWAIVESYASAFSHLIFGTDASSSGLAPTSADGERKPKRSRTEDHLATLLRSTSAGPTISRLISVQTLGFVIARTPASISDEQKSEITSRLLDLLDADDESVQSWTYLVSAVAVAVGIVEAVSAERIWGSSMRRLSSANVCRAAAYCASTLLASGSVAVDITSNSIGSFLRQIDLQGPSYPFDSIASLISTSLSIARSDVRLYSLNLEEKVLGWLSRFNFMEGTRGKSRMEAQTIQELAILLANVTALSSPPAQTSDIIDQLPECPIVEHAIKEQRTSGIRNFILDGTMPTVPTRSEAAAGSVTQPVNDSLGLPTISPTIPTFPSTAANGSTDECAIPSERQQRVGRWLQTQLEQESSAWTAEAAPNGSRPPERIRKAIDLAMLGTAYLGMLRTANIRSDKGLAEAVRGMIQAVRPELSHTSRSISAEHLIWSGLAALLPSRRRKEEDWPILLRHGECSGTRPDLLPVYVDEQAVQGEEENRWLGNLWTLPELSESLKSLVQLARQTGDSGPVSADPTQAPMSTQAPTTTEDDDDFGEIRVAEADGMPLTKEGDTQRQSKALQGLQMQVRLFGPSMQTGRGAVKDTALLNTLLGLEGVRYLHTAELVAQAVQNGLLRLTTQAVELVLDQLHATASSYAYSRDESMFLVVLALLRCSAPFWLAESADMDMRDKAMNLAFWVVRKRESMASWRVHLALLVFIDEYLDYEPESVLWLEHMQLQPESTTDEHGNDKLSILAIVAKALVHRDIRVRIRGATSTAGLWYLPTMLTTQHQKFYLEVMNQQPRKPSHWNAFLTDLLWKLNCMVASAAPRAAVLFHLLEIPGVAGAFDLHLERGLAAVSARLGLPSLATLFETYAPLVVPFLLDSGQSPLNLLPELCGYPNAKTRAISLLESLTPMLLDQGRFGFLQQLGEEAGYVVSAYSMRYAYPATARLLTKAVAVHQGHRGKVTTEVVDSLNAMPFAGKMTVKTILSDHAAPIAIELLRLVALHYTSPDLSQAITAVKGSDPALLLDLTDHLPISDPAHSDFVSVSWSERDYFGAIAFLLAGSTTETPRSRKSRDEDEPQSSAQAGISFNALLQLFSDLSAAVLLGERARIAKAIAVTLGCFPESLRDPRIIQMVLHEVISIMHLDDIGDFAMHLLETVLGGLTDCQHAIPRITDCMIRLGRVYPRLGSHMRDRLNERLHSLATRWRESRDFSGISHIAESCAILWPADMQRALGEQSPLDFTSVAGLADTADPADAMNLCERLAMALRNSNEHSVAANRQNFSRKVFWHIKASFDKAHWTVDGAKAFIDLLAAVEGQVEVVCTTARQGNDERFWDDILGTRMGHKANLIAQVMAIRHLAMLSFNDDQQSRYAAYSVLRQVRDFLDPVFDGGVMPRSARCELPLLLSPYPSGIERPTTMTLSDVQKENMSQYAADPAVWLRKTASCLCDIAVGCSTDLARFYASLGPALAGKPESLAPLLPILTQAILAGSSDAKLLDLRRKILKHLYEKTLRIPAVHPTVVEAILGVVMRMRSFPPPWAGKDALGPLTWIDWDYLLLAETATKAGSFATALLCLEIAIADLPTKDSELHSSRVQNIMLQIYSNVDDPDGFYGIKTNDVRQNLLRRLDHEGHHLRAFGLHGAELEAGAGAATNRADLIASARHLHSFGLNHTARTIARTVQNEAGRKGRDSDDLFFDIAWRTGDWDLPVPESTRLSSSGAFYSALRAVHRERDAATAKAKIEDAIQVEMLRLKDLGLERMSELNSSIDHLICLGDALRWYDVTVQRALSEVDMANAALQTFVQVPTDTRYSLADRQHATRTSILSAAQARENQNFLGDLTSPLSEGLANLEISTRLRFCRFAREEGNGQAAINAITAIQHLEGTAASAATSDEFCAVLWMQGEHALALQQVNEMIGTLQVSAGVKRDESQRRLGVLLGRQAHWSHLSRQLTSQNVVDKYKSAVGLLSKHKATDEEVAQLNYDFACFAADEQQNLRTNGELDTLREYRSRKQVALDTYTASTKDVRRQSRSLDESRHEREQSLEREDQKVKRHEKAIDNLTIYALKSFAQAFTRSDKFDDAITRMCSIWLAQADSKTATTDSEGKRADGIASSFASNISLIPSHKFIFLGPQLAARLHLSPQKRPFDLQLYAVMLRVAQHHPFHILYQIIPLTYGITAGATSGGGRGRKSEVQNEQEGRGPAAARLAQELEVDQNNPVARQAAGHIRVFTDIVTNYAWVKPPPTDRGSNVVKVGASPIAKLPSDLSIPVATVIPPIRPDRNYNDVPRLTRYGSNYEVLGGVHRPKKMKCYDTLGGVHFQLFKSDDEIRQDAIMEQVFGMANDILRRDRQTKARRLNFRTYVVIPLAKRSGIIEFCAAGIAIGDWLKPAHERYRKSGDLRSGNFRDYVIKLQGADLPEADISEKWRAETPKFPPVMRHFFREKQPEPMAWFTMRLNYARSVAVTSMVGHVLGIGDRHLSNIMIDQVNGELIHIDFGIVFEEGLNLRIPERVPFRLTRDMIDGLGVMGVDGTFRRCSEQTLRVLRASSPLIMTILDVFKHDPLFTWMGDPDKLKRAQGGMAVTSEYDTMAQDKADRVLGKIRAKLKDELGVEYTVNQLVLQATNPVSLATIYHGWHAWF